MKTTVQFPSEEVAKQALQDCGFSLGISQANERRGVLFGNYLISKWRNLNPKEIDELDGVYQRLSRSGPVSIMMMASCPPAAMAKLQERAESSRNLNPPS